MSIIIVVLLLIALFLIFLIYSDLGTTDMVGGSRAAIFSRFQYQPEFPFISQLDTDDPVRFSKVYNVAGPVKFITGRPYKYYHTLASTWAYPWQFPQQINLPCIRQASDHCQEPIIMVKKEEDKLGGLGVATPKDIVRPSPCFDKFYEQCLQLMPPIEQNKD